MDTARVFLVVVDDSKEMQAALAFACQRARKSQGRVALLRVIEPAGLRYFSSIDDLMKEEARQEAETLLDRMAGDVVALSGQVPVVYVRDGDPRDELLRLIEEEPEISVLVLAADPGPRGPGPLVTAMTGKFIGRLRIPVTIVPGNLTTDQIAAIT